MSPPAGSPRRKRGATKKRTSATSQGPETPDPLGSSGSSASSPLGLTGAAFVSPKKPPPAATAADLDRPEYEPPKPLPVEWTPDRMEVVVRGLGYVVHAADPVAGTVHAPDLWKMTEDDAKAIAEPLSRIANRYATLRGAAGFSDEIGVAGAMAPYVKRNLAERGRVKTALERAERESPHASLYGQPEPPRQPETPAPEPTSPPVSEPGSQPVSQPVSEPEAGLDGRAGLGEPELAGSENPKAGVADAFAFAMPLPETSVPAFIEPPEEADDSRA